MKLFDVYPLFDIELVKAEGSWLWDSNGKKYLDLYGGHAVISIGHNHPQFVHILKNQLDQISFYSNSVKNRMQDRLADLLGKVSGYPDYQLFLCNSGAEANENALKLASFVTGRKKVLAFKGAFHGRTSAAVAATDDPSIVSPLNAVHHVDFVPLNNEEEFLNKVTNEHAAVIVEGIQGVGGIQISGSSFLQVVRKKCDELGIILILDEIQSGYGRSGKFFAHQFSGITPDLITMAKGMGNGFPVGGVLIKPEIEPKKGMLGTTFGGNYLACAAAISVLQVITTERLMENAENMGNRLLKFLRSVAGIKEVRGAGLMIGFEMEEQYDGFRKDLLFSQKIFTGFSRPNTIRLLPSLALQDSEVIYFEEAMARLLNPIKKP